MKKCPHRSNEIGRSESNLPSVRDLQVLLLVQHYLSRVD